MKRITSVARCTLWLLAPAPLAAQAATPASPDTAATKADPAPLPAGFKLTGFAEGSYAYSGRSVGDTAIVGRLYDRQRVEHEAVVQAIVLPQAYGRAAVAPACGAVLLLGEDA